MINRITAIVVVLFANVVLLANIVIPHHHHSESEMCIIGSHCDSDSHDHDKKTDDHHHSHSPNSNSGHCALNQVYLIPADNVKQDLGISIFVCDKYRFPNILALIFNEEARDVAPVISNRHIFFNYYTYFEYVVESKGLRAPPLV